MLKVENGYKATSLVVILSAILLISTSTAISSETILASGSVSSIEQTAQVKPEDKANQAAKDKPQAQVEPGEQFNQAARVKPQDHVKSEGQINHATHVNHAEQAEISYQKTIVIPFTGYKMVYIPPGQFMMGSPESEQGRDDDETLHKVTLTNGFYMGATEVTQWQWQAIMGQNPSSFKYCGVDCPVERVSWDDCKEFIRRLNQIEGTDKYRLPTEAEWEYACRAGSQTAIYTGLLEIKGKDNAPALDTIAWYGGNSCIDYAGGFDCSGWSERQYQCGKCGIHPVALKKPNIWGLYDMHGNVWEWCEDWYGGYPSEDVTDPRGPSDGSFRVYRGGSWISSARSCRSANRNKMSPDNRSSSLGFRFVKEL